MANANHQTSACPYRLHREGSTANRSSESLTLFTEIEQIEQVPDSRHIARHVGWAVLNGIGQVIATAVAERGIEHPVPFNELHERGMLAVYVADMAAGREGRYGDHRNAWARPEEINRLDKARVVEAATLVHGDEDRGLGPLLPVALRELDDVLGESLEENPLRGQPIVLWHYVLRVWNRLYRLSQGNNGFLGAISV